MKGMMKRREMPGIGDGLDGGQCDWEDIGARWREPGDFQVTGWQWEGGSAVEQGLNATRVDPRRGVEEGTSGIGGEDGAHGGHATAGKNSLCRRSQVEAEST